MGISIAVVTVTGANGRSSYGRDAMIGLRETEALILVMPGETLAILVPKRGQEEARPAALRAVVGGLAAGQPPR